MSGDERMTFVGWDHMGDDERDEGAYVLTPAAEAGAIGKLMAENTLLKVLLLRFEWHRVPEVFDLEGKPVSRCYYCGAHHRNGHLPNCELAKALRDGDQRCK